MARAFLHRLILYVLLLYSLASPGTSFNPFSNLNSLLSSFSPLPIDQTPIGDMAQPGYRSVAYYVVSRLNKDTCIYSRSSLTTL